MSATLAELAARFGCELYGDGDTVVESVGTLTGADGRSVSFLANPLYRKQLRQTRAAAVVLEARHRAECPVAALVTDNPYAAYARIAGHLHPRRGAEAGVHSTAIVSSDARVADTAAIGPYASVDSGVAIGARVEIGSGTVIGRGVAIGAGTRIGARVVIMEGTRIGERCVIHPGAVIGSDGFGFARDDDRWIAVPQLGRVLIGDDVDIGANTTIDRGTIDDTVIESGVKLDNLIQIGHNVRIGAHTAMAALVGIAGSARIGARCMIGGAVTIVGHITICDDVLVTFHSTVLRSIDEPGTYSSSLDADQAARWRRNAARFRRIDELLKSRTRTGRD